jgi:hypothetical protein
MHHLVVKGLSAVITWGFKEALVRGLTDTEEEAAKLRRQTSIAFRRSHTSSHVEDFLNKIINK